MNKDEPTCVYQQTTQFVYTYAILHYRHSTERCRRSTLEKQKVFERTLLDLSASYNQTHRSQLFGSNLRIVPLNIDKWFFSR